MARLWVVLVGVAGVIVAVFMQPLVWRVDDEQLPDVVDGVGGSGVAYGVFVETPVAGGLLFVFVVAALSLVALVRGPRTLVAGAILILTACLLIWTTLSLVMEDAVPLGERSPLPIAVALLGSLVVVACGLALVFDPARTRRALRQSMEHGTK